MLTATEIKTIHEATVILMQLSRKCEVAFKTLPAEKARLCGIVQRGADMAAINMGDIEHICGVVDGLKEVEVTANGDVRHNLVSKIESYQKAADQV